MICSSALGVWGAAALTTDASAKPGSVESFQRLSEWHGLSFWFSYSLLGFVILVLPLTSSLCPVCHLLMSLCLVKLVFFSLIRCQFICSVPPPSVLRCSSCSCLCSSVFLCFSTFLYFSYFLIPACSPFLFPVIIRFLSSSFLFLHFVFSVSYRAQLCLKLPSLFLYPAGLLSVLRWVLIIFATLNSERSGSNVL